MNASQHPLLVATEITTEALTLEPLRPDHASEMVAVLADPALYTFTGGEPPPEDELSARYARQSQSISPDGTQVWLNWIIRTNGQAAGYVQATVGNTAPPRTADIAWVLGTPWQGRGLASRAAGLMSTWLGEHGISQITAHIHPDHHASAAVARSIGMLPQTTFDDEGEQLWLRNLA